MTDNPENNIHFLSFQFYHDKFCIFHALGTCLCACKFFFLKKVSKWSFFMGFLDKIYQSHNYMYHDIFFLLMPVLKTYMHIRFYYLFSILNAPWVMESCGLDVLGASSNPFDPTEIFYL